MPDGAGGTRTGATGLIGRDGLEPLRLPIRDEVRRMSAGDGGICAELMAKSTPLILEYELNARRRRELLALIGLQARDHSRARWLHQHVIAPNVDAIVHEFYGRLEKYPEARRIFRRGFDLARLRATQRDYLMTLGIDFDRPQYFESRLHVGRAHARVPVPLSLYQAAFSILLQLMLARLPPGARRGAGEPARMAALLIRIATLDMCLAIETYHATQVSELKQSIRALRGKTARWHRLADTDRATGLVNQASALILLARELGKLGRRPASVILCDIDGFKSINDRHGHLVGDKVLRGITARMTAAARRNDVVGRYGGDEFVMVLKETPLETACAIAERLRARVDDEPLDLDGQALRATLSLGVAEACPGDDAETLIARADAALYRAKQSGRNRVEVASAPLGLSLSAAAGRA